MEKKANQSENRAHLEKVFQVPARLKIMSILIVQKKADFSELIHALGLTRGNLSMHMKMLEESKYISIKKQFVKNRPKTTYTITVRGKRDFQIYIDMLESIIATIKKREE